MSYAIRYAFLILAVSASLNAQRAGSSGGGNSGGGNTGGTTGGGNSGGTAPTTVGPPPQQTPQQNTNPVPQIPNPVFISGRVMVDDGSALPDNIAIQRVCSMQAHTMAYASPRGQFSFQWGGSQPAGIIPDASEGGAFSGMRNGDTNSSSNARGSNLSGFGSSQMMGCELIASAPGFRSDRLDLTTHRDSDNPDVGVIVLHRLANVEGTSVSATSLNAPKDARKAWEKGVQLLHKAKGPEAEKELQKAVDLYPKFATAWLDLGRARLLQKNYGPAHDAFQKAMEADGKLVEAWVGLGEVAMVDKNWAEAAKYIDHALQLDPVDYPKLWFEGAVADFNAQNYEQAERNARAALKVSTAAPQPRASQLLGLILLNKRDLAGARDALREYVKLSPNASDLNQVRDQLSAIEGQLRASPVSEKEPGQAAGTGTR